MKGAEEEDNTRYRKFLQYCEDRREEIKARMLEDKKRKEEAKRKEAAWELLRTSINFLKEREGGWKTRKLKKCERIKEEEKKDRLAVVRMKKKRYGIGKMSKDENSKLKMRTEERLIIAKVKENL